MAIPRPIDIIMPPGEEDWIHEAIPKKSLKNQEGIVFPNDIVIDHAWKTIRGKQILIRKGDPGALNGNDFRKIDIAVKAASANPGQLDQIRETLVKGYIPKDGDLTKQTTLLLSGPRLWASDPGTEAGAAMCMANNVMKGRERTVGLTKRQKGFIEFWPADTKDYPRDSMRKAVSVQAMFNRGMAKEKFGDKPFTVYRGIYGDQAKAIKAKAKKGDKIRIDSNTLTSFTTDLSVAKAFKTNLLMKSTTGKADAGVVIKATITYKNVFDSYASSSHLRKFKVTKIDEVIVSPKGMKMTGVVIDD